MGKLPYATEASESRAQNEIICNHVVDERNFIFTDTCVLETQSEAVYVRMPGINLNPLYCQLLYELLIRTVVGAVIQWGSHNITLITNINTTTDHLDTRIWGLL